MYQVKDELPQERKLRRLRTGGNSPNDFGKRWKRIQEKAKARAEKKNG